VAQRNMPHVTSSHEGSMYAAGLLLWYRQQKAGDRIRHAKNAATHWRQFVSTDNLYIYRLRCSFDAAGLAFCTFTAATPLLHPSPC
jgi:hypothetical protein